MPSLYLSNILVRCTLYSLFRLKTGNNPPDDLPFEENPDKKNKSIETLGRKKSEQKLNNQKKDIDLFQRKRETEEKILSMECDIKKGNRYFRCQEYMLKYNKF